MTVAALKRAGVRQLAGVVVTAFALGACVSAPKAPEAAAAARAQLTQLQSDPELAGLVPEAIQEAEAALQVAERPARDTEVTSHRLYMANRKIEIARALAEARRADDQRATLVAERDQARLDARTRETEAARSQSAELQREIDALHAQATDRGLVLTLGDVLFETGRAELKTDSIIDLNQLATFLGKYPDRTVIIEGHTDSVGSEASNLGLSQRRADAVRSYLVRQGVEGSRLTTTGMGESAPVASNATAGGRQQNRRVEIIVSNPSVASR